MANAADATLIGGHSDINTRGFNVSNKEKVTTTVRRDLSHVHRYERRLQRGHIILIFRSLTQLGH